MLICNLSNWGEVCKKHAISEMFLSVGSTFKIKCLRVDTREAQNLSFNIDRI